MRIISILQALLTPTIACVTTYIAIRQWHDNHLRLKLERYDRRLRIYQEVLKTLRRICADFAPKLEDLLNFSAATAESPFLFKAEIPAYIDEIFRRANELRVANVIYRDGTKHGPQDADAYSKAIDEIHAQSSWFPEQVVTVATQKFKPYLHIA
jgi:hypothetical protein